MNDLSNTRAIDYKLMESLRGVAIKGDTRDCDVIVLFAPTAINRKEVSCIKGFVGPIFKQMTGEATPEQMAAAEKMLEEKKARGEKVDDERMTGKQFATNATLQDIDSKKMDLAVDAFRRLITISGRGKIEGEPFTDTLFDKLSMDDMENMFYEYWLSFLSGSLLS